VLPSHDPSRISRFRPRLAKTPPLSEANLVVRQDSPIFTSDFSVRHPPKTPKIEGGPYCFRETPSQNNLRHWSHINQGSQTPKTPTPASPPHEIGHLCCARPTPRSPPGGTPLDFPDTPQGAWWSWTSLKGSQTRKTPTPASPPRNLPFWAASMLPLWDKAALQLSSVLSRRCSLAAFFPTNRS
jgi:hypothetical protein